MEVKYTVYFSNKEQEQVDEIISILNRNQGKQLSPSEKSDLDIIKVYVTEINAIQRARHLITTADE